ncbi:exodeoxyribonuclease VII, large subunit [Segatella oulorum F0390]|uniref:Exodeoxyribonuclease 7 large subunit n=1 Tax=Segatella oulorum F0390 TaxID=702438 RepID=G1WEU9_9BACT|nr:exodeoxyribonuclease VII large subunit [Segatella oulorum]EGV28949.1 exodeoxyribonuclease VII, large subunit [Segatella oulorum F0390]
MKTVTLFELNNLVREVISSTLSEEYWVEAELSEVHEVRGHCYMELIQKELFSNTPVAKASAKCWKNKWTLLREKFEKVTREGLKPGMKVLLKVYADFHEAYGFAWIVTDINPEFTMGDMARKRQEIIDTLKREGVFELQKELVLPLFAQRIAVISSENAAGYGDFCHQLADNPQQLKFYTRLFPAVMQGEGVEESVIGALNSINENIEKFDAMVIIRGGGATSDLSGFDTLRLAENVANFPIPIITGIGHDRDESIVDMVAHTKVKTPTAAAALLIDHLNHVLERLLDAQAELIAAVRHRSELEQARLVRMSEKIPMLFSLVKTRQEQRIERHLTNITASLNDKLSREHHRLSLIENQLSPTLLQQMTKENYRLQLLQQRLEALNPQRLLQRGYSITLCKGKVVKDSRQLKAGDEIETKLANGKITSIIQ